MPNSRRGFTIVEVLVVVAIIAVLIGILLPALGTIRRGTRYATCLAQVYEFSTAWHAYLQDNDDYPVYSNWGEGSPGWLYAEQAGSGWRSPRGYANAEDRVRMRQTGLLWDYVNDEGSTYHCPEDDGPFENSAVPTRDMSSYQFNGAVNGYGRLAVGDTYGLEQFRSDAVFMWETDETRGGGVWNDGGNRPDEGITDRHVDGAPVGGMDGSGREWDFVDFYEMVNDRSGPNALWASPGTPNGR